MKIQSEFRNSIYGDMWDKDSKALKLIRENTVYCEHCGHSVLLSCKEKQICTHCGYWVFRNEKIKFKYRMKERLLKK